MRRTTAFVLLLLAIFTLSGCSLFPSYIRGETEEDYTVAPVAHTETTVSESVRTLFVHLPDANKIVNVSQIIIINETPSKVWTDSSTQQDRYTVRFVDNVELALTENDYKVLRAAVMGE